MATIAVDTALDDGTARTAGEAWTINSGATFTVRTDSRWHVGSPASMTGSLGSQTLTEGKIVYDATAVRWLAYDTGTGNVPAIGTNITQGGVASSYLLGVYADLTAAPTAVGAAMPASGFIKFREVSGAFAVGALTGIGANATAADVTGWIEIVCDSAANITVPRLGEFETRGDWFYLDNADGTVGQVIQIPANGGGAGTCCPGVWIETGVGTGEYEFWPALNGDTNGWAREHIGGPYGATDRRQNFVKDLGSGQIQIGEASDIAGTYASIAPQTGTYASIAHSCTYTWVADVVTVYYSTEHLLKTGQTVHLDFTSGGATGSDGNYVITVLDAYYYTVALAGSGAAGNVTARPGHTITSTAHTLGVGDTVYCDFTSGAGVDGAYTIYGVTSANAYLIEAPHSATTSGAVDVYSRYTIAADRHLLVNGVLVYLDFTSGAGVDGVYPIIHPTSAASAAATYTWVANVVTVTLATHGHRVGDTVYLDFTSGGATGSDGNYVIASVPGTGSFTVDLAGSGAAGNVTVWRSYFDIVANNGAAGDSGNVTVKQTIGNIPANGCKIRIPNIILRECATASRASNLAPNATLATRPQLVTTSAGAIDFEYIYANWYLDVQQAYACKMHHVATFDSMNVIEVATALDLDDVGVGMYRALDARAIQFTSNFAGGTVKNFRGHRGNAPGSADHNIEILYCKGQTFTNVEGGILRYARSTGKGIQVNYCQDLTFNSCRSINSDLNFVASVRCVVNDQDCVDRFIGYTNVTTPYYGVAFGAGCADVKVDGLTFGYGGTVLNVHPVSGCVYFVADQNVVVRNIGTHAARLSGGTWRPNYYGLAYVYATGGNNDGVKVQRCYVDLNRTAPYNTINSDKNVQIQSVFGGRYAEATHALQSFVDAGLNSRFQGCSCGTSSVSGQASVYGTHFQDVFLGDTVGRFILAFNEPTTETAGQFTLVAGTAKFNSAGGVILGAVGDKAIWEDSCFRKGHTAFANTTPLMSGGTASRFTVEYKIDTGSGYGAAWQMLSGANLSAEVLDPAIGFKMKIQIERTSASSSGEITFIRIDTISTAVAQAAGLYDLDPVWLNFTVLDAVAKTPIAGARIFLETSPGGVNLVNDVTDASGELAVEYPYLADQAVTGRVRKSSAAPLYKTSDLIGTITDEGLELTALMITDT